jgi:hypothetical protein
MYSIEEYFFSLSRFSHVLTFLLHFYLCWHIELYTIKCFILRFPYTHMTYSDSIHPLYYSFIFSILPFHFLPLGLLPSSAPFSFMILGFLFYFLLFCFSLAFTNERKCLILVFARLAYFT